jgi:hypothetical protein
MIRYEFRGWALLPVLGAFLIAACAGARRAQRAPEASARAEPPKEAAAPAPAPAPEPEPVLEPKAIDLLKAASRRLAAARSMAFTAVVSYENPSVLGPPLIYTTKSDVLMQRPDKLRVITYGDGPPSEFYYDGKTMTALSPAENLVAIADAPPTIDAALKAAFDSAAIYFPFTDLVVADPYADIADTLKTAFYIGQSNVVAGTTTDMVAYVTDGVFVQIWIGAEDELPRRLRAVYRDDPAQLRHQMELSNWQLDAHVPAGAFTSASAAGAKRIEFARPDPQVPPGLEPPQAEPRGKGEPSQNP